MGSERIRIKDIAKMADVSVGTVDPVSYTHLRAHET